MASTWSDSAVTTETLALESRIGPSSFIVSAFPWPTGTICDEVGGAVQLRAGRYQSRQRSHAGQQLPRPLSMLQVSDVVGLVWNVIVPHSFVNLAARS